MHKHHDEITMLIYHIRPISYSYSKTKERMLGIIIMPMKRSKHMVHTQNALYKQEERHMIQDLSFEKGNVALSLTSCSKKGHDFYKPHLSRIGQG